MSSPPSLDRPQQILHWRDNGTGLDAICVINSTVLGPAAGGTRLRTYASRQAQQADATRLARAMTVKCALGGLDAGGCKIVLQQHSGLSRAEAFAELGRRVQALGGLVRTAGDLGVTSDDLACVASTTQYVHSAEGPLAAAVARGVVRCIESCVAQRQTVALHRKVALHQKAANLEGLRIAVQGCGAIGTAVARAVRACGVEVLVADLNSVAAERLASEVGATIVGVADVLAADVDVVVPCATGGVITDDVATHMRAWCLVGAANNMLASAEAAAILAQRDVLVVPDVVASAGAVIDGIGESVMGLADRSDLIDALGATATEVFALAKEHSITTTAAAEQLAMERIAKRA